jgi:hypothetical protein
MSPSPATSRTRWTRSETRAIRQIDAALLCPFPNSQQAAQSGGVDERDLGEVQHDRLHVWRGQGLVEFAFELERRRHVEFAADRHVERRARHMGAQPQLTVGGHATRMPPRRGR